MHYKIMKKFFSVLLVLALSAIFSSTLMAQTNSQSKPNDFLLNVAANPTMDLYGFILVGLNSQNTSLETKDQYRHPKVLEALRSYNFDLEKSYDKVKSAWIVFLQLQKYDKSYLYNVMKDPNPYDIFETKVNDPETKRKLKIVPLQQ